MKIQSFRAALLLSMAASAAFAAADKEPTNPPPTLSDWQAMAKLPDIGGVWTPLISDQVAQERTNPPPWKPEIAKQVEHMYAEEKAGRPFPVIDHCFPTGMPSYMLITHNAFEILLTPGRVTLLGEGDGNRLRRIYTDGRPHPQDPDPSFHGHSIGHWEGQTLVVTYKDGEKKLLVTPETAVVTYVVGAKSDLKPGIKIFVGAGKKQADGTVQTPRVTYGKDGLTPPM